MSEIDSRWISIGPSSTSPMSPERRQQREDIARKMRELLLPLASEDRAFAIWKTGICSKCGRDLADANGSFTGGWENVCHCDNDE